MGDFFGMRDFRDLLNKSAYDLGQLPKHQSDERLYGFCLVNLVITLSHLFDWVLSDPGLTDSAKTKCVSLFNPFSDNDEVGGDFRTIYGQVGDFPRINLNQLLVRRLSNGVKHMRRKVETEKVEYSVRDRPRGSERGEGWRYANPNDPRSNGWITQHVYSVNDDDEKPHDVEEVCYSLFDDWMNWLPHSGVRSNPC